MVGEEERSSTHHEHLYGGARALEAENNGAGGGIWNSQDLIFEMQQGPTRGSILLCDITHIFFVVIKHDGKRRSLQPQG